MNDKNTSLSAEQIVRQDLDEIYIGNLNTVDANLVLPDCGRLGSVFTWKSGDDRFIGDDGRIHRPKFGIGNRVAPLTVTAQYGSASMEKTFQVTVLQIAKETVYVEVLPVKLQVEIGKKPQLPSVVIAKDDTGVYAAKKVTWDAVPSISLPSTVCITGAVDGLQIQAHAEIIFTDTPVTDEKKTAKKLHSFKTGTVRLKSGTPYYKAQNDMVEYLLNTNDDQILYNFREIAKLDTKGAPPMAGWDAPECKLKGHTTGHYLSGLALAWEATGNEKIKQKIEYVVNGLKECQDALAALGYHEGFLSAYSEEQFDLLEEYTVYPTIWAPYYTLDKIMAGLYDCYVLAGNKTALEVDSKIGDWVYNRLSKLPKEQLDRMWSMYIAGEFGAMIATLAKLYQVTGKSEHLAAAYYFQNDKLFYPMSQDVDTLDDMHANQHIPQILGSLDLYDAGASEKYYRLAEHFWNMTTEDHAYSIGGVGETEMFHAPGKIADYISDKTAESCASYNMLRLTGGLFELDPSSKQMDYFERTLNNHILSSFSHTHDGGTTYFMPTNPAGRKSFDADENTCCHGTGMESRLRYIPQIYSQGNGSVYVNLYIPSEVSDNGISLEQHKDPSDEEKNIVAVRNAGNFELCLRVPAWSKDNFGVTVCGKPEKLTPAEDGYLHISRNWEEGDQVELYTPYSFYLLPAPDQPEIVSIAYGPHILAALSESRKYLSCPKDVNILAQNMQKTDKPIHFSMNGLSFIPLWEVCDEAYHVYMHAE